MTTRIIAAIFSTFLLLTACTPGPQLNEGRGVPITRELSPTDTQTPPGSPTSLTAVSTPTFDPETRPTSTITTPQMLPTITPPSTIAPTDGPPPTMTPAPPFPGFRYQTEAGIWEIDPGWQPHLLTSRTDLELSEDGRFGLFTEEGDVWLLNIASGETENLTFDSDRVHCCVQWWPQRPGTIILGSWPSNDYDGPSTGYLTMVQLDGSGYSVLEDGRSNAVPAPSPDGMQIAYDLGGSAWLYDIATSQSTMLDLDAFGMENVQRIAGPSWSPDGRKIAWTMAVANPDWRIVVGVFDLEGNTVGLFHKYENIGRGGWFPGPAWHPDGEWLAFVAEAADFEQNGVWVVNIIDGTEVFLGHGSNPIWSPDGRWLAIEKYPETGSGNTIPQLFEFGSWYPINLKIPDDGRLISWVTN